MAGMRAGLNGARSGLFMEQIRIIQEMRDADRKSGRTGIHIRPRFGIWENVVGTLSSGRDAETGQKSLGRIFKKSSKRSSKLKNHTFMLLDLRPGAGNMLGAYWEYDPPWLGSFGTPNTSECPKDAVECSLWQILQATAPSRYSLSQTACLGILRRAECRGKSLPPLLEAALRGAVPLSGGQLSAYPKPPL